MARSPTTNSPHQTVVDRITVGDAALVEIRGPVDETFAGFGDLSGAKTIVISLLAATRMTSFGVRQWLMASAALPTGIEIYLLDCPTFFVDQLNMVLNLGGSAKVLSVAAPYACPGCGVESSEIVDVLAERSNLAKRVITEKPCRQCGITLELDETPESYFAFVAKYGATSIQPAAAELLANRNLYASAQSATEKPPKIMKLVHGRVTYFRITGMIGSLFRARPFLVGIEGEVVLDLTEVERFEATAMKEWRRMLKSLAAQTVAVSLVDVSDSLLRIAGDSLAIARNIVVASLLVPYACQACGRTHRESANLENFVWPIQFGSKVCPTCAGTAVSTLTSEALAPLQKAGTRMPEATGKVVARRDEIMSRAYTDAAVASAGDRATAMPVVDELILGKYRVVKPLSAGGMAEVFVAMQVGIGGFEKPVALKRIQRKLLETRQQAIELFLNEAKIASRLMHPNIVQVLDVDEVGGALYLAMEYVHGKDLRKVVRKLMAMRATMPLAEALHIVREVALALHYAYWSNDITGKQLSVVHRDVSPHNVVIGYDGMVKLLDFGVAMSAVTEHTETIVVGKWQYMSPEITLNENVDHRSDLFSLGVVLYLLTTGAMPFAGPEPKQIVRAVRGGRFIPARELAPIPEALDTLIARMLGSLPEDRPATGQQIADALAEIQREHDLTSSPAAVASFLQSLFPETAATDDSPPLGVKEVVRLSDSMPSTKGTPSYSTQQQLPPIDVSETFRRSGFNLAVPMPRPGESPQRAATEGVPARPVAPPGPRSGSTLRVVLWLLVFFVAAAAGYFLMMPR
jgi:eukaryotic-like serine/threonine-protein kinase